MSPQQFGQIDIPKIISVDQSDSERKTEDLRSEIISINQALKAGTVNEEAKLEKLLVKKKENSFHEPAILVETKLHESKEIPKT